MAGASSQGRAEQEARARVIEEHLPLVEAIARRHARGAREHLDDLVQAGSIGLIKAVDRFDPDRGNPLAAFAGPFIDGEIRHHLRDGRRRVAHESADELDAVGEDLGHEHSEARLLLARGWAALSARERRLLALRYFGDLTQGQVATEMGMSQAQVSRLLRATLDTLREVLGGDVADREDRAYSAQEMATPEVQPEQRPTHSGRLLVRMPQSLHAELARAAEREGVSLNALVTGALAGAVGWRDGADAQERSEPDPEPEPERPASTPARAPERRWLSIALAANFVIVALAAVLAIVLLVLAWQGG